MAKFPAMAQPGLVAAERVFEFLDAKAEITDRPGAGAIESFEQEIVFDSATMTGGDFTGVMTLPG